VADTPEDKTSVSGHAIWSIRQPFESRQPANWITSIVKTSSHQLWEMAAPLQIHERTYPQEPASFALNKATPPDKQIQLPLTPPTTDERFSHGSDRSAVASALQIFKQHQEHCLIDPWTSIQLKPIQYERFLGQLKQTSSAPQSR